jgi:hypothetical protein
VARPESGSDTAEPLDTPLARRKRRIEPVNRYPRPVYMIRIACTCCWFASLARGEAGAVRVRGGAPGG